MAPVASVVISVNDIVDVAADYSKGFNLEGGRARVTKVHKGPAPNGETFDIKFIVGSNCTRKMVPKAFLKLANNVRCAY